MATKYVMEQGVTYLIKEPKPDDSLKIFASLVKHGSRGFCVTRVHPKRIRKRFELGDTPILWITTSEVADEKCVHPSDLAKLNMAINEMLRNFENLVILLEGIEYLVTYNGFDSILRFVQVINDRIMVTNSRFLITLDPATLDSSSLHILERDLTPVEDLSRLEVTFSEFPEAAAVTGDRWKPQLEERLRQWRERGLSTAGPEKALQGSREEAHKAFDQFESYAKRALAVDDELRGLDLEGFGEEAALVRKRLADPSTIKEAEDGLVALQVAAERRTKDRTRRKVDEGKAREELRSKLARWTSEGYVTSDLAQSVEGTLDEAHRDFERFEGALRKLGELREELLLMDTTGFETEVESIRTRLNAPARVSELEDDIFRLKILIERRRKEERRRQAEEERSRTDFHARLDQWAAEGFSTGRLAGWEGLPPGEARRLFEQFEKDASELREIEAELGMISQPGLDDEVAAARTLLRDVERLPEARQALQGLRSRLERTQEDRRRQDFERKIQEWKVLGYNTDRLAELAGADADKLQKELVVFKIRVHRLKELEGELALLDTSGFSSEVKELSPLFKDVDRISEVESRLTELRLKIRGRSDEARRKREDQGRRKRDLVDRMSVWLSQGYSVARLEELLDREMDLDKIAGEFDRFEQDIVRLKELSGRLRTMDTSGFEREAAEVRSLLSDLSRVSAAEEAVGALEARMRQSREELKRQAAEEERRRQKAQQRIQAYLEQGLDVSRLQEALGKGMEAFKQELSMFSLRLEKLRGIREDLAQLDARGFETDIERLRAGLEDLSNVDSVEEGVRALRTRIADRRERERQLKEAEKDERKAYIQKLLDWSAQGLVVERLEQVIDRPIDELRTGFDNFERALQRLDEIRRAILGMDLSGLDAEADAIRLELNDPALLPDIEQNYSALLEKAEERDHLRAREHENERRRETIRGRVEKMRAAGISVSRMERFLDGDLETLENELDLFLEDLKRLRALRRRFDALDRTGQEGRAAALEPLLNDPDALERIESELEELELVARRRTEAESARRGELGSKVDGWERGGLNVGRLREAARGDLAGFESAVADFERDLEDYRRGMERVLRFEKEFIAPSAPVAEKVEGGEEGGPVDGPAEAEGARLADRAVAEDLRRIRGLRAPRRDVEERIRLEQRLRTTHRALQRQVRRKLDERRARSRRNRVLAACAAAIAAALVLYAVFAAVILPGLPGSLAIDGRFSDWDGVEKRSFAADPTVPDTIDVREAAMKRQDGHMFCYVRTQGTILKGTQDETTKFYKGDSIHIYFDTDRTLSSGLQIGGIGADHMVNVFGWNNRIQEIDYLRYNASTPQVPWEVVTIVPSDNGALSRTQLEVRIDPRIFGLEELPADLVAFQTIDSEGNTDIVS
ncbi:MAG: DUF835 domain-containing protein [Euryarchaeota archaeon]|nr:DUF835 domain-containing protein [Euryarchaeota archaeon]